MYKVSPSHSANKCNLLNCSNSDILDYVHSSSGCNVFSAGGVLNKKLLWIRACVSVCACVQQSLERTVLYKPK